MIVRIVPLAADSETGMILQRYSPNLHYCRIFLDNIAIYRLFTYDPETLEIIGGRDELEEILKEYDNPETEIILDYNN